MITILSALVSLHSFRVRRRASLEFEFVALRHQVIVLWRQRTGQLRLFSTDRLLWVRLYRVWRALLRRSGFQGVVGQGFAERPNRARHAMAICDDCIEGAFDPLAIRLRDYKRRQKLNGGVCVASDLDEDLVVLEQRDRDELTKQAGADRFEQGPRCLELERAGRSEFNACPCRKSNPNIVMV